MSQYVVIQQGGTSREWYVHSSDTNEDALAHMESCREAAYNVFGPYELPDSPTGEQWFDLMETVLEDTHGSH